VCKDKEKNVDFRMKVLDFLKQQFIVFQSRLVPLSACIFFAEKAKKDTAAIGAMLEVFVFKRSFSWDVDTIFVILRNEGTHTKLRMQNRQSLSSF
jgi:hypothetical protein